MRKTSSNQLSAILSIVGSVASVIGLIAALKVWLGIGSELSLSFVSVIIALILGVFSNLVANTITKRFFHTQRIFLSYPHRASSNAQEIAKVLRKAGVNVWIDIDNLQPGQSITSTVEMAISESDIFVAVIAGVSNSWELREIDIAKKKGMKIVPVLVEGTDVPKSIQDIYYIDLRSNKQENLQRLVNAVI